MHPKGSIVSVFGTSRPLRETDVGYALARRLGRLLAEAGYVVATGGYQGSMEAVSRGAKEAGGHVIGVTTSLFDGVRAGPNPYLDEEIKFPSLVERLFHLVTMADAWVALPGGMGTLTEIALSWNLMQAGESERKPLVVVGAMWREFLQAFSQNGYVEPSFADLIQYADDAKQVLAALNRDE
jgi:uncharacterized protein (TIGR00730 family)